MTQSDDSLARRDFFKVIGAAALPLLTTGCDPEAGPQTGPGARPGPNFRAGPKAKARTGDVEVGRALLEQFLINDKQRCSLPAKLVGFASIGQQVRINRPGTGAALYTVDELRKDDNPDYVRMSLSARLRIGTADGFSGTMSNRLTASGMSDAEAEANSEFVERVVDDGHSHGLVVVAPHGGGIEPRTDSQAERLTSTLAGLGTSSWICKGWSEGGGAFDRWHIRSTDLDPRSFAGLSVLAQRRFDYCVAFHGMDVGGVLIGGAGPLWLKQQLSKAIRAATNGLEVAIADPSDVYDGDSATNLVNWLTVDGYGGIQIEQSRAARVDHGDAIVDAIADVFGELL